MGMAAGQITQIGRKKADCQATVFLDNPLKIW